MNRSRAYYAADDQLVPHLQMQRCSLAVLDLITVASPITREAVTSQLTGETDEKVHQSVKNLVCLRYIRTVPNPADPKRLLYVPTGKRPHGAPVAFDPRSAELIAQHVAATEAPDDEPFRIPERRSAPVELPALPAAATSSRGTSQQFWFAPSTTRPCRRSGSMDFARVPSRTGFVNEGSQA